MLQQLHREEHVDVARQVDIFEKEMRADDEAAAAAAAANSPAVPEAPSSPVGTPAPPPELPAAGSRQQGWQLVEPSAAVSDEGLARANKVAAAWVDVRPTYAGTTLGSGFELL